MARRRFADEPTSRLAIWARRCAFFALTATVLSILIVRSGILEVVPALATFAGALVFAVIGIVLAFGAFIVVWKDGINGMGHAFGAIGIGAALIAYPAYLGYRATQLPMINDISTDSLDPPRFVDDALEQRRNGVGSERPLRRNLANVRQHVVLAARLIDLDALLLLEPSDLAHAPRALVQQPDQHLVHAIDVAPQIVKRRHTWHFSH